MALGRKGYQCEIIGKNETRGQEIRLFRNRNNRNSEQSFLRCCEQKSTVSDLVYNYLRKVAYTDSVRKHRNNACNKFRRNTRKTIVHPSRRYSNADGNGLKSYISKALSFAVHSGYLIPTDGTGRFLALSPCLMLHHTLTDTNDTHKSRDK
ncbi:uncharacterized protein LOC122537500 [Frieseomelitta varia]|uniref:uncharacterized protein LOC122537500 n=1 Tax=Frieseomelitta varia TaxID=561572 RepID=UPI001CB6AD8D|nr:uncharacterized protein LOC122537500 [Frieseomelitta varia]